MTNQEARNKETGMDEATSTVMAWDDEWQRAVVMGTHDPEAARKAYRTFLDECGFKPGDDEYDPRADQIEFYEGMDKRWTFPKDEEEPFDLFTESGEGRVPYMFGSLG